MSIRLLTIKYPKLSPNINMFDLMDVWKDLIEAYHGVNSHAGDTAEIYGYRLRLNSQSGIIYKEDHEDSVENLVELCKYFSGNFHVTIKIDGLTINQWEKKVFPMDEYIRAHVQVIRKKQ